RLDRNAPPSARARAVRAGRRAQPRLRAPARLSLAVAATRAERGGRRPTRVEARRRRALDLRRADQAPAQSGGFMRISHAFNRRMKKRTAEEDSAPLRFRYERLFSRLIHT